MKPTRGIVLMILAVTCFTLMSSFIKAADRVPAGQAVFFRAGVSLPIILIWLGFRRELKMGLGTKNLSAHFWRGIAGTCAMGLGFAGLRYLPLPEVTAIRFVTPILIVIFAAVFLGETIRKFRITAVLVGHLGVVVIVWPRLTFAGTSAETFGALITLGSATLAAAAQIFVKSMAGRESTLAIVFYFSLTAVTLSLLTIPFGWVWPSPAEWALLIGAGLVGGLGQVLLTTSYRFAEAGVLAPFTYTSILWALVIGYVWFGEVATAPMLAGAALIMAAGVAIVLRERYLGLRENAERKVRAKGLQ